MKPFEILMEKGENAGYQYFLLFPQCFQFFNLKIVKSLNCGVKGLLAFNVDSLSETNLHCNKQNNFKALKLKLKAFADDKINVTQNLKTVEKDRKH